MRRREFLRAAGGSAAAAGAVAAGSGTAAAQSFGGWMDNVGNFSGEITDATGQGEVTVTVGAEGNGGAFAFDPPAVQVDPGTTVKFEWTGNGGQHNVVTEEGGDFESELFAESGVHFEHTFESESLVKYFCQPHLSLGMKGVVVVGSAAGEGGGGSGGGSEEKELEELGVPIQAHWVGSATILGIIVSIIYTFYILKYGESPHTGNTGGRE